MTRLCRGFVLAVLSVCVIQAEWFDKGKVSYETPDGKWRKAAIHVTDDGIEVYDRKNRSLVATFSGFDPESHKYQRGGWFLRRALLGGSLFGAAVVGGLAMRVEPGYVTDCSFTEYSSYYSEDCTTRWSEGREAMFTAQTAWKTIGVMSAVAATIAAISARPMPTEYTFTDGPRSITVRVGKKNQDQFTNVLSLRRNNRDRAYHQPGSAAEDVAEAALFVGGGREQQRGGADLQKSEVRHHSDGLPHAGDEKLPRPPRGLEAAPSTVRLQSLFSRQVYSSQPGS